MNKPFLHRCFLLAITLLLTFKVNAQKTEKDKTPQTITLKSEVLVKTKQALAAQQADKVEALKKFLEEADNLVKKGKLYSVVDKKEVPPSGDKHDYMSIGPYWWPDTTKPDGLPYIRRDGERNPEYYDVTDASYRSKMSTESEHLALAYYFTNDGKYAEHAANLLKTWFLNAQTKMNPNLNFGQGIPGINTGRGIGIIETRGLTEAIDAAILLRGSKSWSEDDHNAFKKWFSEYLTWLTDSPLGNDEAKAHNNHGTHYDAQVICFALFTGQNDLAKKQFEVTKGRIASQFLPDGSQPHELERTTSWNYTNMNLHGFFDLARLGEHFGIDLWHYQTADKKSIRQCLEWLVPFLKNEKKWTHQQIKKREFEVTVSMLKTAAVIYKNADYETLAKQIDPKVYAEPSFQLFY